MLERAWEIGAELILLKEKVYHGQWTEFCKENLAPLSFKKIERYIQLARYKDRLLAKYKNDKLSILGISLRSIKRWRISKVGIGKKGKRKASLRSGIAAR
jgi:hypothetical protein